MRKALLLLGFFALFSVIHGKFGLYNDYRRPVKWNEDFSGEDYKKIEELANYLRKRAEEAEAASIRLDGDGKEPESENEGSVERGIPPFEYNIPSVKPQYAKDPDFAVGPSDPRFYEGFVNFGKSAQPENENVNSLNKEESYGSSNTVLSGGSSEDPKEGNDDRDHEPFHSAVYQAPVTHVIDFDDKSDIYFTAIVAGCSAAAVFAVVAIGISCYSIKDCLENLKGSLDTIKEDLLQKNAKAAAEVDYPAYGVTGPHKDASPTSGDRRLAQSAQMYHYQHQKQQIIAMESRANSEHHGSISDAESDEENEEGDYTVYECPGLASTGEMEVKNPLFQDDQTPVTPKKSATEAMPKQPQEPPKRSLSLRKKTLSTSGRRKPQNKNILLTDDFAR